MGVSSFKELDVWKKGIDIADAIYEITSNFPGNETYGLCSQMQRAAVSIPSNIAEGYRRFQHKDYMRFLRVALGSCAELETQLIIASRRNFISKETFAKISDEIDHESRMIINLINVLSKKQS